MWRPRSMLRMNLRMKLVLWCGWGMWGQLNLALRLERSLCSGSCWVHFVCSSTCICIHMPCYLSLFINIYYTTFFEAWKPCTLKPNHDARSSNKLWGITIQSFIQGQTWDFYARCWRMRLSMIFCFQVVVMLWLRCLVGSLDVQLPKATHCIILHLSKVPHRKSRNEQELWGFFSQPLKTV